jgi:hypothetical protein
MSKRVVVILPNFLPTSFCFGAAAIIALDYLLNTGLLNR